MAVEFLTYAALGERLEISTTAARALARGLALRRSVAPDGRTLVLVDVSHLRAANDEDEIFEFDPDRKDRGVRQSNSHRGVDEEDAEHARRRRLASRRKSRSDTIALLYERIDDLQRQLDGFDCSREDQSGSEQAQPLLAELFKISAQAAAAKQTSERTRAELAAYRSRRWWRRAS